MSFRAGDIVLHRPSRETWVLACDQHGNDVLPAGWPESVARPDDCELIQAATDDERLDMLRRVAALRYGYRCGVARRQLEAMAHA